MAVSLARSALLASVSIVCLISRPAAAQAAPEAKEFSISAQSAETAIGQLGRQGEVQIIAAHKLIHSVKTNAVSGDMTVDEALNKLLAGTGLTARQTSPNTYAIVAGTDSVRANSENVTPASLSSAPQDPPPASSAAASPNLASNNATEVQGVVVTGLRHSLESARGIKESADGIVDAITLQDIGKLPDANLAESLQRITGVTIDRSGGEGEFVTVRGFGPEFNTVLVNGRQIATPTDPSQASGRAFSFDTLASELVSGVDVYKSSTAIYQSGGVGATVNILTARPFDFKGLKFSGSIDENYDTNAERGAPDASFLFSDILDGGKLGVLLSGSYQERYTRLNEAQTDGWLVNPQVDPSQINGGAGTVTKSNPQGNLFVPQDFDTLVTTEDRVRIGGTMVVQYRPVDNVTVTLDALYSKFSDTSDDRSFGNWFTASNLTNIKTNAQGTVTDMTQASGIATDFHDEKFSTITDTGDYGLNVDWKINPHLTANFDASYSEARELPNDGQELYLALLGYMTGSARYQSDSNILPWTTETLPTYANPSKSCGATPTGASGTAGSVAGAGENLCQHVMLLRGYGTDDQVSQLRADFTWKGDGGEGLVKANWGLYFSNDRKNTELYSNDGGSGNTTSGYNYPAPAGVPITVYNAGSGFLSGVSGSNRLVTQWQTFGGPQLFSAISAQQRLLNPGFTFAPPEVSDTIVTEQVLGGYFQSDFRGSLLDRPFSVVAGVRVEDTATHVNALSTAYSALVTLLNDQTQYGVSDAGSTRVTGSTYYLDILPNIAFNWKLTPNFIARLAASQTMTRPTLEDLSPVMTLVTIRPGDFAASSGNPQLKPFRSNNLDLSGEYYYGRTSYVSLGAYVKNVTNFIVLNETTGTVPSASGKPLIDPGTGQPAEWSITAPVNGPDATVTGLEGAWQQTIFDTGFGFQLNGTLVGSNRQLDTMDMNDKFAVTGLSNSFNMIGFYAKNGIEARIAYTWRDHFLQYLAPPPLNGAGQAVTQVRPYGQLDASLTYHITDRLAMFWEGANLTNSTLLKYAYYTNQFEYAEQDGVRLKVGFRFTY
jgi:iron complex outermembrane recepter protein